MIPEFDPVASELENGFTVIEASAGTGKTTTISAIVLRLLVERGIEIEKILVTTYTELATAELRGRIRDVITDALEFLRGAPARLPNVSAIISKSADRKQVERWLEIARLNFDRAPIFTIHGFCARVLGDRAFEAGLLFDTELTTDQSRFLNEVADDFWRIHLYRGQPLLAALLRNQLSPAALVELLVELTNNPIMRVLPPPKDLTELKNEINETWEALCRCWTKSANEIRARFSNLAWAKGAHRKTETVEAAIAAAEECIGKSRSTADVLTWIRFFSARMLQENTRARGITPQHVFFDQCQELDELTGHLVLSLQSTFCEWAQEELRRRKADRRVQSFDDLLTRLNDALHGEKGDSLRKDLRDHFAAALIDEFQDTDPVQYSIFHQIYHGSAAPVFLIGDPKQAIYGFRGADVFTYLQAADSARRRYTLGKNWRSEAKLVEGVSEIFQQRENAFVLDRIRLTPVHAAGKTDAAPLTINDQRDQPLRFWIVPADEKDNVPRAVAAEIARLLSGRAKIGDRRVEPKDIAVLVMTNSQPAEIRQALAEFRIPSVVYSTVSVFESREAKEMLRVLRAVLEPTRASLVRSALATETFGRTASELEMLATNERQWEQTLNRFSNYHALWRDHGFVEMLRDLLVKEELRGRILSFQDGERRLTNVLHLVELLHAACAENRFGMEGLVTWLERQILTRNLRRDEYELRLETDDDAVRIVTIHKSKGLEFGIAFCPFARKEPLPKDEPRIKFHAGEKLVLDLARSEESRRIFNQERLAESVRQLYVGLTRAHHRSYCVWQENTRRSHSALAWLLSSRSAVENFLEKGGDETGANARAAFEESGSIAMEGLPALEENVFAPATSARRAIAARVFEGKIDRSWGVTSFSALVSGTAREVIAPDYDSVETELETEPLAPAEGIHSFPGGTRAGTCIHKILETLDFQDRDQIRSIVSEKLAQFRISGFDDILSRTITRTLEIPLGEAGFTLSQVRARLPELEFIFPITRLTAARLQGLFKSRNTDFPATIGRLQFDCVNGFLKGFVDLVFEHEKRFYLLDWKSNWLGPDASFYTQENMASVMSENSYTLQLSIYSLALHRYLSRRLPGYDYEKQFGGAFYIFLRGIENASRGVFAWHPPRPFIEKLHRVFYGNGNA